MRLISDLEELFFAKMDLVSDFSSKDEIDGGNEDFADIFGDVTKGSNPSSLEDGLLGDPDSCGMCG